MEKDGFEISRRKVLAGVGGIGAASAGAGMGTSAFFSDTEEFTNNRLVAGELDLNAAFQANYSDWSEDEDTDATQAGAETFLRNTRTASSPPSPDGSNVLATVNCDLGFPDDDDSRVVISLTDVKPGDFGFVAFKLGICGTNANPGYLWTNSRMTSTPDSGPNDENGQNEPEAGDDDEGPNLFGIEEISGELAQTIRLRPWYAGSGGSTAFESLIFDNGWTGKQFAENFFEVFQLDPTTFDPPTLLDYTTQLAQGLGLPLTGDPANETGFGLVSDAFGGNFELVTTLDGGADFFTLDATARSALAANGTLVFGLAWGLPVDHANEIQTDSVAFDLGFYTEQERHNSGLGSSIGSVSLEAGDDLGDNTTGQIAQTGQSSTTGYGVTVSETSFSGTTGPVVRSGALTGPEFVVGLHAPFVGSGLPDQIDSLIGVRSFAPGAYGGQTVPIGSNDIAGADTTSITASQLQTESPFTLTATLWHGFISNVGPSGPVRDVDGNFIQDTVDVEFQ